ncbi:MAG: methyltransferase [Prevotella sp.]|nr:methyltransferase [Prevotella sp.]
MSNNSFRFKRFEVRQDRCAMKVGTDGVLLGAWAEGGLHVLDVGTGTGLIALMMAQRFPEARVVGIDIDGEACRQAQENVAASPFSGRVEVVHTALQQHEASPRFYDAIVSNPPFFEGSLKNPDSRRALARHAGTLDAAALFRAADRLLTADGILSVVVPADRVPHFLSEAAIFGFYLSRKTLVQTVATKPPKRSLLAFVRHRPPSPLCATVQLLQTDGSRSEWYQRLTGDFYL